MYADNTSVACFTRSIEGLCKDLKNKSKKIAEANPKNYTKEGQGQLNLEILKDEIIRYQFNDKVQQSLMLLI